IILSMVYDLKKIDYLYFTKLNRFQKETLKILKLSSIRIIDSKFNKHCLVDNLMFCTHPHYFKGTLFDTHSNIPKWIIYYLRKMILAVASKKIE